MIGATATLEYRAVVDGNAQDAIASGRIPPEAKVYQRRDGGGPVLLNKRVIVTGDQMVGAQAVTDSNSGSPERQREQADGGGLHRARADRDRRRRPGSAWLQGQRGSDLGGQHHRRVRQELPDHRPAEEGSRRPGQAAEVRLAGGADGLRRRARGRPEPGRRERQERYARSGVRVPVHPGVLQHLLPHVRRDHLDRDAVQPADRGGGDVDVRRDHDPAGLRRPGGVGRPVGGRQRVDQRAYP
ncbi:hypothetical protein G6F59_013915 [Rhizopus arrhizus]|nr:hypothetical protein G6F59_013915 [Rhizopus arrhizus]